MFKPSKKKIKKKAIPLNIPPELDKRLELAKESSGLTKTALLIQMIEYCLSDIRFEIKKEGDLHEKF